MENVILLHKPVAKTPLEMIEMLRERKQEYKDKVIGCAGRLDPMAHGLLLLLISDENKNRKMYERLSKSYEFEILYGVATDSYDCMGLITSVYESEIEDLDEMRQKISLFFEDKQGGFMQEYPPFSSVRVMGRPLYWWTRQKRLLEIEIPSKKVRIDRWNFIKTIRRTGKQIAAKAIKQVQQVRGEFRQQEIISGWEDFMNTYGDRIFIGMRLSIDCSSGVYVRSLANELGSYMGYGAVTTEIKRTAIGEYRLADALSL